MWQDPSANWSGRVTDLKLSVHQFQPEPVAVSELRPELCLLLWELLAGVTHPGHGHKGKHRLLLLLQSTGMRQGQQYLQQLLAVTAVPRTATADAAGQSLQPSLLYRHC